MVHGLDCSHWQKTLNWKALKESGYEFAFIKATEGGTYKDPMFLSHAKAAKDAGLLIGAYHYLRPKTEVTKQIDNFLESVGKADLDLPHVLDLEDTDGLSAPMVTQSALLWCEATTTVKSPPIIYTGLYFVNDLKNPKEFAKYPLWIAQYRNRPPTIPRPFEKWTFWQYTSDGGLDKNWFNGSLEELNSLVMAPDLPKCK